MLVEYLKDRTVQYQYNGKTFKAKVTKGCPQGSNLGPLLWIIIYNVVLKFMFRGCRSIGFADDLLFVFGAKNINTLEQNARTAITQLTIMLSKLGLSLNAAKTQVMVCTRKHHTEPIITVNGQLVTTSREIKYLGVIIDQKLTFIPHFTNIHKKSQLSLNIINRLFGRTYGYGYEARKIMAQGLINSLWYYGSAITLPALKYTCVLEKIRKTQRATNLKIISAYRTVSDTAASVIAGMLPLDLAIAKMALRRAADIGYRTQAPNLDTGPITLLHKDSNRTKNAYIMQNRSFSRRQLDNELTSMAYQMWQSRWDLATTGRVTYEWIPDIAERMEGSCAHLKPSFFLTQALTGHGFFADYLKRFKIIRSNLCVCGNLQSPQHLITECTNTQIAEIRERYPVEMLDVTPTNLQNLNQLIKELFHIRDSIKVIADKSTTDTEGTSDVDDPSPLTTLYSLQELPPTTSITSTPIPMHLQSPSPVSILQTQLTQVPETTNKNNGVTSLPTYSPSALKLVPRTVLIASELLKRNQEVCSSPVTQHSTESCISSEASQGGDQHHSPGFENEWLAARRNFTAINLPKFSPMVQPINPILQQTDHILGPLSSPTSSPRKRIMVSNSLFQHTTAMPHPEHNVLYSPANTTTTTSTTTAQHGRVIRNCKSPPAHNISTTLGTGRYNIPVVHSSPVEGHSTSIPVYNGWNSPGFQPCNFSPLTLTPTAHQHRMDYTSSFEVQCSPNLIQVPISKVYPPINLNKTSLKAKQVADAFESHKNRIQFMHGGVTPGSVAEETPKQDHSTFSIGGKLGIKKPPSNYTPMGPYVNRHILEDVNRRIIFLRTTFPPTPRKSSTELSTSVAYQHWEEASKEAEPRRIISTAQRQLLTQGGLDHPYSLIFSDHVYIPAMQYLVLRGIQERFYAPVSAASVGDLLPYEQYLDMHEPTPRDVETRLIASAAEAMRRRSLGNMALTAVESNGLLTLEEANEDIFLQGPSFALAHCVSQDLRMSAGIARDFVRHFGGREMLLTQPHNVGEVATLKRKVEGTVSQGHYIIFCVVTKIHYYDKPTYKDFSLGIQNLARECTRRKIKKLAIPRIGCGLDQLDWGQVRPIIVREFREIPINIKVCNWTSPNTRSKTN
ncbi:uncharacterized protein LOC135843285 [Planococcus citri]|uniref:uncharacterized protein LOC135843285 n=2 Tax=Planococcus citri TaxID=170843 RepID=UPI0031F93BF2